MAQEGLSEAALTNKCSAYPRTSDMDNLGSVPSRTFTKSLASMWQDEAVFDNDCLDHEEAPVASTRSAMVTRESSISSTKAVCSFGLRSRTARLDEIAASTPASSVQLDAMQLAPSLRR